nr:odorant binding protein 6 [Graphosoma rubrolineatum]
MLQKEVCGIREHAECQNIKNDINTFSRCCRSPEFELSEEKKAIAENCHRTIISDRPEPNTEEEREEIYECFEECYFKASHWLTADLKPNETMIIAEYNEGLKNFPQWKEPIIQTVKACIENDFSKPESKCKSGAYQFSNCLERNMFLNCPEDSWQGTDQMCINTKRAFEKCIAATKNS